MHAVHTLQDTLWDFAVTHLMLAWLNLAIYAATMHILPHDIQPHWGYPRCCIQAAGCMGVALWITFDMAGCILENSTCLSAIMLGLVIAHHTVCTDLTCCAMLIYATIAEPQLAGPPANSVQQGIRLVTQGHRTHNIICSRPPHRCGRYWRWVRHMRRKIAQQVTYKFVRLLYYMICMHKPRST